MRPDVLWCVHCPDHSLVTWHVTRVTRVKAPDHGECHCGVHPPICPRHLVQAQATAHSWRESQTRGFIVDSGWHGGCFALNIKSCSLIFFPRHPSHRLNGARLDNQALGGARPGLFRTHQVTLSWVGPELISNNIIPDIISRLSKDASDTKFDILPQFTYTYAFNLPQTPNFLALTLTNSSLSPRH